MPSHKSHGSWSLRPEELLIESARQRLAARVAFDPPARSSACAGASRGGLGRPTSAPTVLIEMARRLTRRRRFGSPTSAGLKGAVSADQSSFVSQPGAARSS